jgi:NADPH:quinone reductase-like Zn-dependent oxidoreductase
VRAARITRFGDVDAIALAEVEPPRPAPGEVLIAVHASSINPVDVRVRTGELAVEPPLTLGSDVAGIVAEVGAGVRDLAPGDEVYGHASVAAGGSGAFADYAVAPAGCLAKKPRNLDFTQAAAVALTGVSALQAIRDLALRAGQRVLVHGGAGGIGTIAIQLAKHAGAFVVATATGDGKIYARRIGADAVMDPVGRGDGPLVVGHRAAVSDPYDAVLDAVGGSTYLRSFALVKRGGVIVSMTHAPDRDQMSRHGVTSVWPAVRVTTAELDDLRVLIEHEVVRVRVDRVFGLERVREAFRAKESGHVRGKIAIRCP